MNPGGAHGEHWTSGVAHHRSERGAERRTSRQEHDPSSGHRGRSQTLRIGRRAIVSFPNFGHWRVRVEVGLKGRMPMTENLPYCWYDTPNIHFCTIRDFVRLCREVGSHMERAVALDAAGQPIRFNLPWWAWNLFGEQAVFLLRRGD